VPSNQDASFLGLLRALTSAGVEFVVVGGISAVLQGAPLLTYDLDVVHRRTPENIDRLLNVLAEVGARYRIRTDLSPQRSHLQSEGHQLLATNLGPLDLLGTIFEGDYEQLAPKSIELEIEAGLRLRVLSLEAYLREKSRLKNPKDTAAAAILRSVLKERGQG
jgi:hypothetical protein